MEVLLFFIGDERILILKTLGKIIKYYIIYCDTISLILLIIKIIKDKVSIINKKLKTGVIN
jgi:hypothetical protein